MKKYHFLVVFLISTFIIACNKNDQIAMPKNEAQPAEPQNPSEQSLTEINEPATKQITWAELPPELRNATPIESFKDATIEGKLIAPLFSFQFNSSVYGGPGGNNFNIEPPAGYRLRAIGIGTDNVAITRLTFWYRNSAGNLVSVTRGNGAIVANILLPSTERIVRFEVRSDWRVRKLRFITSLGRTLTAGANAGTQNSFSVPGGIPPFSIQGFRGGATANLITRFGVKVYQ